MPVVSFNSSTFLQLLNNLKILPNHPAFDSFDMHSENELVKKCTLVSVDGFGTKSPKFSQWKEKLLF